MTMSRFEIAEELGPEKSDEEKWSLAATGLLSGLEGETGNGGEGFGGRVEGQLGLELAEGVDGELVQSHY